MVNPHAILGKHLKWHDSLQMIQLHLAQLGTFTAVVYSRVSFCDGLFYDSSLLWPLSSRTEDSGLVVHHCRNSRVLSLLSVLLALFQCACVSSFSILVQFFFLSWLWFFHPWRPSKRENRRKKIKTIDVTFLLDVFWTTAWAFFSKIKSNLIDIVVPP